MLWNTESLNWIVGLYTPSSEEARETEAPSPDPGARFPSLPPGALSLQAKTLPQSISLGQPI